MKKVGLTLLLLASLAVPAFVVDCQSNGIGGSFCTNDDSITTDAVPNEANDVDTYSNSGGYTSPLPDQSGADEAPGDSTIPTQQDTVASNGWGDSALADRDWHVPSNLNDGTATSGMSLLDEP